MIYIDNADEVEVAKFLSLITTFTGPTSSAVATGALVKAYP